MTTGPLIDSTVVENLILAELLSVCEPAGIRVLAPHEEAPAVDADQTGDTPDRRWCRLGNIILTPTGTDHIDGASADMATATITITVGVALPSIDPDQGGSPTRINADVHTVASALDGARLDHDATSHRVRCERTTRRIEPSGFHETLAVGIVTLNAGVSRTSGRDAVLTS